MTTIREAQRGARRQPGGQAGPSARRRATRERLMDAATELFAERGVLAASVEEICERAGFTRGAFYSNFESKDELCLDVLRRKGEQHLAAMQAAIAVIPESPEQAGGTERLIRDAVAVFLEAQPKEVAELVAMMELRLHAVRTPELRAGWLAVHEGISSSVSGLLEIALERVGARVAMPTPQVIELLGAVYENTVSMSLLRGEHVPTGLADELAALLDALIQGDCGEVPR
ncbi:MAG: TetR/AcrR family transcriptional regulator [Micropruina sp.]|uniref:TetR/AcrR family transcriptional regulator n=1 Tax=Micropruina sp. TaxID=2737536 RepID=UPI0039E72919